jgi:hypothetical protein
MFDYAVNLISNLNTIDILFILYFSILFIIWLWTKSNSKLNETISRILKRQPKYELSVNKKEFVCEIVRWGLANLSYEGASQKRKRVEVQVSYYPHKKFRGTFSSFQNKIKVYVNNHPDIDELIDTSLHEVVHLLQYYADKKNFDKRYAKLLREKTYEKHPMEMEANEIAAAHTKYCKYFLINQGMLRKIA